MKISFKMIEVHHLGNLPTLVAPKPAHIDSSSELKKKEPYYSENSARMLESSLRRLWVFIQEDSFKRSIQTAYVNLVYSGPSGWSEA